MALVLALEPDPGQAAILRREIPGSVGAELVLVESGDAAIAALSARVPDVVLLTALLSPRDEEELIARLRAIGGAEHMQVHTIPQLASAAADTRTSGAGWLLRRFRRQQKPEGRIEGCDPALFSAEVRTYAQRAEELKALAAAERATEGFHESPRGATAAPPVENGAGQTFAPAPGPGAATPGDTATEKPAATAWDAPFEWRREPSVAHRHPAAEAIDAADTRRAEAEAAEAERRAEAQAAEERERLRLEAEAAAERERLRLEAEAAAERERLRLEAEAAAERERLRREAEAAAERERLQLVFEAEVERERLRLEAEAAAEHERLRLEFEAEVERQRLRLEAEAAAEHERQQAEADQAAAAARARQADPFGDFREGADEERAGVLRFLPIAGWARRAQPAPPPGDAPARGDLHALLEGLALPPRVAGISYARGCRVRRVRVPARTDPAMAEMRAHPVILSRQALEEARSAQ